MLAVFQKCILVGLTAATAVVLIPVNAQVGDAGTLAKEKLISDIKLTKSAADHSDIVTAGDVVLLHKDGLMMCSSASSYAYSNTYANGVLSANNNNRLKQGTKDFFKGKFSLTGGGTATDAANNACTSRKFVAGEKFWVTDITLQKDGILVSTLSDPYNDVRYYGEIKFPFAKGAPVPSADVVEKTVNEVLTVQPSDDKADSKADAKPAPAEKGKGAAAAAEPAATAALAPIAPPPPPPDQPAAPPKTISKGQTKDVVIATWGQPSKVIQLGTKEILVYPDMKVTFVSGKVSDVQ